MSLNGERPPFWGSWGLIYAGLALYLVVIIAFFTWFTRSWNR